MAYFTTTYPEHSFTLIILTYKNRFFPELSAYCAENNIKVHFLDHIEEKDFIFPVRFSHPNTYRLFYSMSRLLETIPKSDFDCIIRLRIDSEVKEFEILNVLSDNTYYSLNENNAGRCSDNIGYGTYNVMRKVWKHENCLVKGSGIECVLFNTVRNIGLRIIPFKYHYVLYQSNDAIYDGVVQWSRRSREWIYDGKNYILNDISDSAVPSEKIEASNPAQTTV